MYLTLEVRDLNDFERVLYYLKSFIFRGQSQSDWKLQPKIDRLISSLHKTRFEKNAIEYAMIEKCQKNALLYLDNIPDKEDYYSWFSLIQHYDGPTRFLDFSYSPYIALFFAINGSENSNESALWCINTSKIWQNEVEYFNLKYPDNWFGNFRYITTDIFNKSIFDKNQKRMNSILLLDQRINHQRIAIQQGTFLTSLDENTDFETCLHSFLKIKEEKQEILDSYKIEEIKKASIIKFLINRVYFPKTAKKLKMMNLTTESLFPGFEGFIRSIYMDIMTDI